MFLVTAMGYLLDADVCIAYLRGTNRMLKAGFAARSFHEIYLSPFVKADLYNAACTSVGGAQNSLKVEEFVAAFTVLPFDNAAACKQAEIQAALTKLNLTLRERDIQLAAIAMVRECSLVTQRVTDFSRIGGLDVESWG